MKRFVSLIFGIMVFLFLNSASFAKDDYGIWGGIGYSFVGGGLFSQPDKNLENTSFSPKEGDYNSLSVFNICGIGYYSNYMGGISFSYSSGSDFESEDEGFKASLSAKSFKFRLGKRKFSPGDLSYSWGYVLGKYFSMSSSYNNVSVSGYGYGFGYEVLSSFWFSDIEFLFNFLVELYLYKPSSFSPSYTGDYNDKRTFKFGGELAFGIGLIYEPYGIGFLLKIFSQGNDIQNVFDTGSNEKVEGMFLGESAIVFEVLYNYRFVRYNR